jgi:hypothetical protein
MTLFDEKYNPRRPWRGFSFLVIIAIAGVLSWYFYQPIGLWVKSVFQQVIDAFHFK